MKFSVFLKGVFMGICDLVPGISGGTIAFVTGIYERLITAVSRILTLSAVSFILTAILFLVISPGKLSLKRFQRVWRDYDVGFLFTLFLGIGTSLFLGSRLILFLLSSYFVFTMSFFVGLIVASLFAIYGSIDDHHVRDRVFGILGFLLGVSLLFLIPSVVNIGLRYVFLSGFVGVGAMFLPGISGSYLLYVLGSYEYMLGVLRNPYDSLSVIFVFLLGAVLGAVFISRFIVFMFAHYRSRFLYVLFGFVVGSLAIPVRDIFSIGFSFYGLIYFLIGFVFVFLFSRLR